MPEGVWILPSQESWEIYIAEGEYSGENHRGEPWCSEIYWRFQLFMKDQEGGLEQTCNFATAQILIMCPVNVGVGP